MKFFILSLTSLLLFSALQAQNISVADFKALPNDMDARINAPKDDQNGKKCAIIKVITSETGFNFDIGMLGVVDVVRKTGEYWVYVPHGAQRMTISHDQLGVLRDYIFRVSIEEAAVYSMQLTTGRVETRVLDPEIATQWMVFSSEPSGADVFVDDNFKGQTPLSIEEQLGKHNYRIVMTLYHPYAGQAELKTKDGREEINAMLKPMFGSVNVTSVPESGAEIFLDDQNTGKRTPALLEKVPSGEHQISLRREWYSPKNIRFTMEDGQTIDKEISMDAAFAEVTLTADKGSIVFVNNESKNAETWNGRLMTGWFTFEAKKDKHRTASKRVELKAGEKINLELKPEPITGDLKISSVPFDADVMLNGEKKGNTPITLRDLLIGTYLLELSKPLHGTYKQEVEIKENETTTINQTLLSGMDVRIESIPSGASLSLNGKNEGQTPARLSLSFGSNAIVLNKAGYVPFMEKFDVTEGKQTYNFTMKADELALAESKYNKARNAKYWWLGATAVSAGTGAYFYLAADNNYKKYQDATDNATDLHNTIKTQDNIWPIAFGVAGACAVMTTIQIIKQGKAKKQIRLSAIPVDGGVIFGLQAKF
ncbi:MAG: PEGA domain-containing protein [Bacteroidales bacterium]|nr:PEGA domain-containing protein [Bacteroidales bacterium]